MNYKFIVITTLITFVIFFVEGLILFNFGKKAGKGEDEPFIYFNLYKDFNIYFPNITKIIKIMLTVMFFAAISGWLSSYVINRFN
jgi:hypothetical protein